MEIMSTPTLGPGYSRADLDRMPDDGNRYELLDGEIVMSPSPHPRHQLMAVELLVSLHAACPDHLRVVTAPLDVVLADNTVVVPDLVVVAPTAFDDRGHNGPPLLAVEILSPSTRGQDLVRKKRIYEEAGISSYWILDPEVPSLTAWELREGRYVSVAAIAGDESWAATAPYDVTLVPSALAR